MSERREDPAMTKNMLLVAAAAPLSASIFAGIRQQATHGKPEYDAVMSKAKADMKAALAHCNTLANGEETACSAHAKAAYEKTTADAKAAYRKSSAQLKSWENVLAW
jgi:16S rRNA G527 N7-methylase RsmG